MLIKKSKCKRHLIKQGDVHMNGNSYDPTKNGAVTAIRIFYGEDRTPMAELAFAFGGTATIEWTNVEMRKKYIEGINGYTFFFDERDKASFLSFVKKR